MLVSVCILMIHCFENILATLFYLNVPKSFFLLPNLLQKSFTTSSKFNSSVKFLCPFKIANELNLEGAIFDLIQVFIHLAVENNLLL